MMRLWQSRRYHNILSPPTLLLPCSASSKVHWLEKAMIDSGLIKPEIYRDFSGCDTLYWDCVNLFGKSLNITDVPFMSHAADLKYAQRPHTVYPTVFYD